MSPAEQFEPLPPELTQHPNAYRWLCSVCKRKFVTLEHKPPERCLYASCRAIQLQLQQTRIAEILARAEEQAAFERATVQHFETLERRIHALESRAEELAEERRICRE